MTTTVRQATVTDVKAYRDRRGVDDATPTCRAWVGEVDGEMVAIGGFALVGSRWLGFFDILDDGIRETHKAHIGLTAARIMRDEALPARVYANLDPAERGARRWLERLGFKVVDERMGLMIKEKGAA